jgi:hypothetical protein
MSRLDAKPRKTHMQDNNTVAAKVALYYITWLTWIQPLTVHVLEQRKNGKPQSDKH